MDAVYIADAQGRYLPASEGVFIAGEGGRYPNATLPPGGALLTIDSIRRPSAGLLAGHALISGRARPGVAVTIQAAPDLKTAFAKVETVTADANGNFEFDDPGVAGVTSQFYRAVYE